MHRADNSFDCVLLLEVLEHLDDYRQALREIFRVSSRHVIISVPNEPLWRVLNMARGKYWGALGNTPGHVNHWNRHALTALVNEFGVCRQVRTPLPWLMVHAGVRA
ncbi:MAG: methyltransferase domain-containing protein [Gammaproteobacteria bacterium]|jgi:ubiquinone/menaquinone biosynthesis C-methylase UbiE